MRLSYLLIDLDETLYSPTSGLLKVISSRMTEFVARRLGIELEEAIKMRRSWSDRYGTTLAGLIREVDATLAEEYLHYTHDVPAGDFIGPDKELEGMLASISLPKSILTNSPSEHADRVLALLGIRAQFERIFDIRFNGLLGKPDPSTYARVLEVLGRKPGEVLLVDDRLDYLLPFGKMGGRMLLVANGKGGEESSGIPRIGSIRELASYLAGLDPG